MTSPCKQIPTCSSFLDFQPFEPCALSRILELRSPGSNSRTRSTILCVYNMSKEEIRVLVEVRVVKHTETNVERTYGNTPLATFVR